MPSESKVSRKKHICLNCAHWKGDRPKQWEDIKNNLNCMDLDGGWPLSGDCSRIRDSIGVYRELIVDANFGCVLWEELPRPTKKRNCAMMH